MFLSSVSARPIDIVFFSYLSSLLNKLKLFLVSYNIRNFSVLCPIVLYFTIFDHPSLYNERGLCYVVGHLAYRLGVTVQPLEDINGRPKL